MMQGGGPGGGYEFTEAQNQEIKGLAGAMSFVGILLRVSGIVQIIAGILAVVGNQIPQGVGGILQGILNVMLGGWTGSAANSFDNIVKTQGNDINNLMAALGELRRVYGLYRFLIIAGLVIVVGAFVLGFFMAMAGAALKHH